MVMPVVQNAQLQRTLLLIHNRPKFLELIEKDIKSVIKKAKNNKMTPCFRLNGTSDLPWLSLYFAEKFPDIQFYDYTKIPEPWKRIRDNYHITFSLSENNFSDAINTLNHDMSVAVVFDTKKDINLPTSWKQYPVVDGDDNDLRFLDPKHSIIGLRAKGLAKKLIPGKFVQISEVI
jgi:hypothetical protein